MNNFNIDKNIPMPATRRGRPAKYHWSRMKVGDSVAFPKAGWDAAKASAQRYFKDQGWSMSTRLLGEFGRIWRTK